MSRDWGFTRRRLVSAGLLAGAAASGGPATAAGAKRRPKRPLPATFAVEDGHLVAGNAELRVVFDGHSGGVRRLRNERTGQELLADPGDDAPLPWRLDSQEAAGEVFSGSVSLFPGQVRPAPPYDRLPTNPTQVFTPSGFRYKISSGGRAAQLTWDTGQEGVRVTVRAVLGDGDLELWPTVHNDRGAKAPQRFTYPLLERVLELSPDGAEDDLVYPQTSAGFLYRTPFDKQIPNSSEMYPDGYLGNAMQVMGYFRDGVGGFAFEAHDAHATTKYLRFRDQECSLTHESWDLRNGAGMDLGYPVVIAAMVRGDFYEVAEHYRRWAIRQKWCALGPTSERGDDELARWAYETVGVVVWGMPSNYDWSPWFEYYSEAVGTPLHIVTGYDWAATTPWPVGFEGWFPARFHPKNVEAYKGHYVTPYMNDISVSESAKDFELLYRPAALTPLHPSHQPFPLGAVIASSVIPSPHETSTDRPDPRLLTDVWWFMCPTTAIQKNLHVWRDRTLIEQNPFLSGVQYDITWANNEEWAACHNTAHGHTPGSGRWINDHYLENARRSKAAMTKALGRYASQGTEVINETCIAHVDHYDARILGGPQAQLEGRQLGTNEAFERPPGQGVECVPFFDAVYHDYAPVRHDGYAQLRPEYGDIFYWVAARIYLQYGGLVSLDYNVRWPEAFPGYTGTPQAAIAPYDGVYHTAQELHPVDEGRVRFLRQLAQARVGAGNPWLAYGRLVRPTGTRSPATVSLDYASAGDTLIAQPPADPGAWDVPQLLEAAWLDPRGRLGLFFVNLHERDAMPLTVDVDARARWGIDVRGWQIVLVDGDRRRVLGTVSRRRRLRFTTPLPPRVVTQVYLRRPPPA